MLALTNCVLMRSVGLGLKLTSHALWAKGVSCTSWLTLVYCPLTCWNFPNLKSAAAGGSNRPLAPTMFFPHFVGDACSREVLSIQRRVCAAVWAKVPPTNARNGRVNWRKPDDLTHRRPA
jgi:hypothetical protein